MELTKSGGARIGPNFPISGGGASRTEGQDDSVQNEPPQHPGRFHHPRVAEELFQIRPQCARSRSLGSAQIDQQYADTVLLRMAKIFLPDEAHL